MVERSEELTTVTTPLVPTPGSYVDWPAIFAGAVLATAIAFLFSGFGAALGLSLVSPYAGEGAGGTAAIIAVGLWMLWTTISSSMAGGYVAGRMRRRVDGATSHEVDVRDGVHGVVVWGVGVLLGAMLLGSVANTTARVGGDVVSAAGDVTASAVAGAADSAASGVSSLLPAGLQADPFSYAADALFREGNGLQTSDETRAVEEATTILLSVVRTGEVSEQDRAYLTQLVAQQTGLSQDQAQERVAQAVQAVETARNEAVAAADAAAEKAKQAAETARQYSILAAFLFAASLLVAGAAAYWAAGLGGRHRDEGRVFTAFGRWV